MTRRQFLDRLEEGARQAGVDVSASVAGQLSIYFELLARWNRKTNLAGFDLDTLPDEAVGRLFIEPLVVAARVNRPVRSMIDIGSGGGSPGIPMALALSAARVTLVEARERKAIFLAEVVRALDMSQNVRVENHRFETLLNTSGCMAGFDLLSVRAVRVETLELDQFATFLEPDGRIAWFGSNLDLDYLPPTLRMLERIRLSNAGSSSATILGRQDVPRGTNSPPS